MSEHSPGLTAGGGLKRLILQINTTAYSLRGIPCVPEAARKCFELRKFDGTLYHVSEHAYGAECDCPDFIFRRDSIDRDGCKHVRALMAVGLLSERAEQIERNRP